MCRLHRAVGKMPRFSRHNLGKSIILSRYYFSPATILALLSYTKMVNIAAIGSVFDKLVTKNSKCFPAGILPRIPLGGLPRLLVGWVPGEGNTHLIQSISQNVDLYSALKQKFSGALPRYLQSQSQFSASLTSRHAAVVLSVKSQRLWLLQSF